MREKIAFASGQGCDIYSHLAITERLWLPFYNIGLGLSPAIAGGLLMALRLIEAFASPVVGNLSDNTRSHRGRRWPWLVWGSVGCAVTFPAMFLVSPDWADGAIIAYTLIVGGLFFLFFTVWSVPYFALGMELTPNYNERTRLGAWMALAAKLLSVPASWILLFVTSAFFLTAAGKPDIVAGVRTFSFLAVPLILIFGLLPAILVRERFTAVAATARTREPLRESFIRSARCGPLWPVTLVSVLLIVGFSASRSVGVYVNLYYVFPGNVAGAAAMEGLKSSLMLILGIVLLPLLVRLVDRYDKRPVIIGLLLTAVAGNLSNFVFLTPEHPYLQLLPALTSAGLASSVWMFFPAMRADVADYDELGNGRRREGSLNAFGLWFYKSALVASAGLDGLVLTLTGFDAGLVSQPPEVLQRMVSCFILLPSAIWIVGAIVVALYRLDRRTMQDIRGALEARRGVVEAQGDAEPSNGGTNALT